MDGSGPLRRVLVVRFGRVGDLLAVTPAIRAVRRALPEARIDLLTGEMGLPALATNRHLDERHTLRWRKVPPVLNPERALLLRRLRRIRFDVVLLVETSEIYRRLAEDLREPRIYAPGRERETSDRAGIQPSPVHAVDRALAVVARAGIPADGRHYDYPIGEAAQARAGSLIEAAGASPADTIVGLHAGHYVHRRRDRPHEKKWPTERYVRLVKTLIDRGADRVILTGTRLEAGVNRIITGAVSSGRVVDLAGRTDLETLAAVIARCALFVSPDTGPAHLAAAVGTPLVALYGPTSPALMGAVGDESSIRRLYPEPSEAPETERAGTHPRMWAIELDDVLGAIDDLGGL